MWCTPSAHLATMPSGVALADEPEEIAPAACQVWRISVVFSHVPFAWAKRSAPSSTERSMPARWRARAWSSEARGGVRKRECRGGLSWPAWAVVSFGCVHVQQDRVLPVAGCCGSPCGSTADSDRLREAIRAEFQAMWRAYKRARQQPHVPSGRSRREGHSRRQGAHGHEA